MARRPPPGPRPTVVCFVRHGTTPTTGKVLPGHAKGLHLSDKGTAEAVAVAERLGALGSVRAVYASPLERARETAKPIAARLGLPVTVDRGLLECDFGEWTGAELATLSKLPEWQKVQRHPSGFRFPSGESFSEMQSRLATAIERLVARHPGEVIVAVSHADPIKIAVGDALGQPLDLVQRTVISPCSVSVVSYGSSSPAVLAVNSTGELAHLGIGPREERPARSEKGREMSELYEFSAPDKVTVGTLGPPGQRVFYLQARQGASRITLKVEKTQIAALATHLGEVLQDLVRPGHLPDDDELELEAFGEPDFTVGPLAVAYDAATDQLVIVATARVPDGDEADELRVVLTREQAGALAIRGARLVDSGRPPCPLCGFPLDPRGHACPRTNGHSAPIT